MKTLMIRHTPGRSSTKGLKYSQMDWVSPEVNGAGFHKTVVLEGETYKLHHSDSEYAHYRSEG